MPKLFDLFDTYIFSGVPRTVAYDAIKFRYKAITRRSWEDLFLDAFDQAVKEDATSIAALPPVPGPPSDRCHQDRALAA